MPTVASLADTATDLIKSAILRGDLPAGTRLSVPELARQLNVSRTPAREALIRLEREGLVSVTPRRGAVVLQARPRDLNELFEYREALEGMAARLSAERMTEEDKRGLRDAFEAHARAVAESDLDAHLRHDQQFHELLAAGSRNSRIIEELARVRAQLQLLTLQMSAAPGAVDDRIVGAHRAIVLAIEGSDKRAAESAARGHVRGILEFYENH